MESNMNYLHMELSEKEETSVWVLKEMSLKKS